VTFIDTLLIDGTDVAALPGVIAVDFIDGLYAPGARRGDDDDVPGRDGSLGAELPLAKYLITVPVWVKGATTAELNSNLRTLGPLVTGSRGLVTLTRRLDNGAGYDEHTAAGRFATGLTPTGERNQTAVALELQFYNLDGAWFDSGTSTWLVPMTRSI
jgi:hypothetical protein